MVWDERDQLITISSSSICSSLSLAFADGAVSVKMLKGGRLSIKRFFFDSIHERNQPVKEMTMVAFKIMRGRHYQKGGKVDTREINYGRRMLSHKPTIKFINDVLDLSEQYGAGFGETLVMCVGFQADRLAGVKVPKSLPGDKALALGTASRGVKNILEGDFSATFWETLYERVRFTDRPSCPSRLESYFACRDTESLKRYRDKHWSDKMGDKMVCQIDVQGCSTCFEADTAILDRITEDMNYSSAKPHVLRYWDQEVSDNPIKELLLQGNIVLLDRVSLG